ncbi:MAG: polyribonucleotide nucleotidyltransferase [Bdellovibrionales bacterium]|nr:polyribonucleotide nucleotidyltransferase [Bdellovibrionales bacterium]
MIHTVSCELGGKTLTIETGLMAKQANGSALVKFGDTRVLVTACMAKSPKPGLDFFPLTVEYSERFYSSGKIPGGFLKREGRPTSEATLSARMIDRPIRPLFPEGFRNEVQLIATVLSLDTEADADVAAAAGVSAALSISDIPFNGPTAACRIGRINGQLVVCPTWTQVQTGETDLDVIVAGTAKAITMVEGGAKQVSEEEMLKAVMLGHEQVKKIAGIVDQLKAKVSKPKLAFVPAATPADIVATVEKLAKDGLAKALRTKDKGERYALVDATKKAVLENLVPASLKESEPVKAADKEKFAKAAFEDLHDRLMRNMILDDKIRIDGRDTKKIRQIDTMVGILPRVHGSSLFTRGETQVLAAVTLGTKDDEQMIDSIYQKGYRQFMLHYNFAPFSVGETGRYGGQSRREIGHGALAERAVSALMPPQDEFPYVVRIVCETLESNGSSSMGSVCSASMALMEAGVPFPAPVAGIAMGLIKEGDRVAVLSDILGDEDHLGDMDFKVAGTDKGVTAIQMDIKIEGVTEEIMRTALAQAKEGRLHILSRMADSITQPKQEISPFAPRIVSIQIPTDKIGAVIGPQGKMIKAIVAETGCKIDIEDTGRVNIASSDGKATERAIEMIQGLTAQVEIDKVYKGLVKKITDFGAFVGVLGSQDGLLHVSEIAHERVHNVTDYLKEGDEVEVKVIDIDGNGRIRLSRKVLLPLPEGFVPSEGGGGRGDRGDRGGPGGGGRGRDHGRGGGGRGPRDGDRGGRGGGGGAPRHN